MLCFAFVRANQITELPWPIILPWLTLAQNELRVSLSKNQTWGFKTVEYVPSKAMDMFKLSFFSSLQVSTAIISWRTKHYCSI